MIRNKRKYPTEYYDEVYKNYLRISDSLDSELVLKYARMYRNKEAENFAKNYIHCIINNDEDFDYYFGNDKNKKYEEGAIFGFHGEECECCQEKTLGILQEVCYKCGWWNPYKKTIDENKISEENGKSLREYRNDYYEILKLNPNYTWAENRNRIKPLRKIVKKTIIDEEKNICSCCGRKSINKWYDQCSYCGWIADYVQEDKNMDFENNGPNKYPLWWYKEDYELFIKNNPNYIYKNNPRKFKDFLERDNDL